MTKIICGAWPYANGSLHIGHLAALLPGDVLARYFRSKNEKVFYISGSDCHGTPITIRAKEENSDPKSLSDGYHYEFLACFSKLNFTYDLYSKTSDEYHKIFVQDFYKSLYDNNFLIERVSKHAHCDKCNKYLLDRYIYGQCPSCNHETTSGVCDYCGQLLDADQLLEPICSQCLSTPNFKISKHLYMRLKPFESIIKDYIEESVQWRPNTKKLSLRYISEGLRDRATTRDITWGIDVPIIGYENKKIYVWIEAVLSYLSSLNQIAQENNYSLETLWNKSEHYYFHGKDNIPFHTIILPSLLLAKGNLKLPENIIASEHVTLNNHKISTSQNWAIWLSTLLKDFSSDTIRYYFIAKNPEYKDMDFSFHDFINTHNSDLVNTYGNFINRNLSFVKQYFDNTIPDSFLDIEIKNKIDFLYKTVGSKLEMGSFRNATYDILETIRWANKYFDSAKPWLTKESNPLECSKTIYNCLQLIVNFATLLKPIMPNSSEKILNWFNLDDSWITKNTTKNYKLKSFDLLFEKIDPTPYI